MRRSGLSSSSPAAISQVAAARPATIAKGRNYPTEGYLPLVRPCHPRARARHEQHRVECAEQRRRGHGRGSRSAGQLEQPILAAGDLAGHGGDPGAGVAQRQPGPARQVPVVGWAVPAQEPARELRQRRLPLDARGLAEPVAHQRVLLRAPSHRAADDQSPQRGEYQQVDQCLALDPDACRQDRLAELLARERAILGQGAGDRAHTRLGLGLRDALLAEPARVGAHQPRRHQGMEPVVVLAANQVQRPAVQPADHQRALVRQGAVDLGGAGSGAARPHGHPHTSLVLALEGEDALRDTLRVCGALSCEHLRGQAFGEHLLARSIAQRVRGTGAAVPCALESVCRCSRGRRGKAGRPSRAGEGSCGMNDDRARASRMPT